VAVVVVFSLFLFFLLLLKIVFSIISLSTWFRVGVSNPNFTVGFLLNFYFLPGLEIYICLPCLGYYVWLGTVAETYCHLEMNVFYGESKTDLKLWCYYCIKFQLFEGAQDVFNRLTAVCCMSLPHNPYRLSQHYKRHIYGPSCSCKHWFLQMSPIFEH
jgi:hypothetical protein